MPTAAPKKRKAVVRSGPRRTPPVNVLAACQKVFRPARSFAELVALVRDAERRLAVAGTSDNEECVSMLRGLYYGTPWSNDFASEQSATRNLGFDVFAGFSPADPRAHLDCNLYQALQKSQDMRDGGRHFDFGHLIIGVDARASFRTRSLPVAGMGGTGLELSTWLGDLGGGAAMLAFTRGSAPSTSAITRFRGTDFGGSINLEGDVAGFVVAHAGGGAASAAALGSGGLAAAIAAYVADPIWPSRAELFESMYEPAGPGRVAVLIDTFAAQIEAFAVWYLLQRLASKGALSPARIRLAAAHVTGAARECATLFVEALEHSRTTGGGTIEAAGSGPKPTPAGSPNRMLTLAALAAEALD